MINLYKYKLNEIQLGILSVFFLFFLWTCSAGDEDTVPDEVGELENLIEIPTELQPTHDITVQKDKVFGDFKRKAGAIGGIGDIAVDDSGRVFIADLQQKTIHVFDPNGAASPKSWTRGGWDRANSAIFLI